MRKKMALIYKIFALLICVSLIIGTVAFACASTGCTAKDDSAEPTSEPTAEPGDEPTAEPAEKTEISVGTLKGPTGIGMAQLMEKAANDGTANKYNFYLAGAPEDITAKIISGELDVAAVPTNLAAVLYNKQGIDVQIAGINTIGGLSLLEIGDEIHDIQDLRGKTIYATGQGATPEYIINYILKTAGIADLVTIEYAAEHSELAARVISGEATLALLPEPFVTTVLTKNENARIAFKVGDLWDDACEANDTTALMAMGGIIVRKDFLQDEKNKEAFNVFMEEYADSVIYVTENVSEAATLVEKFEIMASAALAEKAIPNCSLVLVRGTELRDSLEGFLKVLFDANPKSVGGALPGDDFYYAE